MNPPVVVNVNSKPIDFIYFKNYGGGEYSKTYQAYTASPLTIVADLLEKSIDPETLLDIGCASGELVRDFRKLGIKAYGIENNKEILLKSIIKKYCVLMDMLDLHKINDNTFDVIYSNSFMYLFPQQVLPVLKEIYRITKKAVYLCNPFLGDVFENQDPYCKFLASRNWWNTQFKEAGFFKVSYNIYKK